MWKVCWRRAPRPTRTLCVRRRNWGWCRLRGGHCDRFPRRTGEIWADRAISWQGLRWKPLCLLYESACASANRPAMGDWCLPASLLNNASISKVPVRFGFGQIRKGLRERLVLGFSKEPGTACFGRLGKGLNEGYPTENSWTCLLKLIAIQTRKGSSRGSRIALRPVSQQSRSSSVCGV